MIIAQSVGAKMILTIKNKPMIPTKKDNPNGLHQRYNIRKITGGGRLVPVDEDAEYFVLRLDTNGSDPIHIKACRVAIHTYANMIEDHLPELANDLRKRYPIL